MLRQAVMMTNCPGPASIEWQASPARFPAVTADHLVNCFGNQIKKHVGTWVLQKSPSCGHRELERTIATTATQGRGRPSCGQQAPIGHAHRVLSKALTGCWGGQHRRQDVVTKLRGRRGPADDEMVMFSCGTCQPHWKAERPAACTFPAMVRYSLACAVRRSSAYKCGHVVSTNAGLQITQTAKTNPESNQFRGLPKNAGPFTQRNRSRHSGSCTGNTGGGDWSCA